MVTLWKKATSPAVEDAARDIIIKRSLTKHLSQYIRDLQQELITSDAVVSGGENASNVCFCLEAIFIHGLKDTFSKKMSSVFKAAAQEKIPSPDFWTFVMVYTHRDVLAQINQLSQITTDIGRCRAWVRLALNENLFVNYVDAMIRDPKTVRCYYRSSAYMADREQPDILKQFLDGLTNFSFRLPVNCSILNHWNTTPLHLAGIQRAPLDPVMPAIDVADFFHYETRQSRSKLSLSSSRKITASVAIQADDIPPEVNISMAGEGSNTVGVQSEMCDQHEHTAELEKEAAPDDRLSTISEGQVSVGAPGSMSSMTSAQVHELIENLNLDVNEGSKVSIHGGSPGSAPDFDTTFPSEMERPHGNLLDAGTGWSSPFEEADREEDDVDEGEVQSYDSLVLNYTQNIDQKLSCTPEFTDLITSAMMRSSRTGHVEQRNDTLEHAPPSEDSFEELDFEIVPVAEDADEETKLLVACLGTIQQEKGLDQQEYKCRSCATPIGMTYGSASLCNYDGYSYCSDCIGEVENVIPARIIHNWDFKRYRVSRRAKAFLGKVESEPLLDLRSTNASLYSAVPELAAIQVLRTQLGFLRPYLQTCSESVCSELRRIIWPREYLYEHVHVYATFDLLQVPSGALQRTLQRAIAFARKHIKSCHLCSAKGFVCEVCRDPAVIYAFDMDVTHHCSLCFAVYHRECYETTSSCPRCERRKQRELQAADGQSLS
ncbi:pleckstrin homology domain-containing family M member 1-like [Ornithodoros turicata]|uniref:pleckstrin homology domain-containing family M member 1-like n=1 Tax=Ornithodoros turicata TaxID=34597 RepID=UPI00313A3298